MVDQVPDTGDSVFQIVEGNFTWNEAQADAEAKGGKLAVLNNKEKIDSIKTALEGLDSYNDMDRSRRR